MFRSLLGPDLLIVHLHVAADTMRERMEKRHSGNKNIVDELEVNVKQKLFNYSVVCCVSSFLCHQFLISENFKDVEASRGG